VKRITLLDFIRVRLKVARLEAGIFAVVKIIHVALVEILNILGNFCSFHVLFLMMEIAVWIFGVLI
jgi:hypothetical protein